jgi:predicted ATP-binding protein involved in virulence
MQDIGQFSQLSLAFAPTDEKPSRVTVLIGQNCTGKTTVLNGLATSLSWLTARINNRRSVGERLPFEAIRQGLTHGLYRITVSGDDEITAEQESSSWQVPPINDQGGIQLAKLAGQYRNKVNADSTASLPLMVYFGVERNVCEIRMRNNHHHSFEQIDGYDGALRHGVDLHQFYEWLHERLALSEKTGLSQDRLFDAINTAITTAMPEYNQLGIDRSPRLHFTINKQDQTFALLQLSQAERSSITMVADIARRLAMLNPGLDNPLLGEGVILIDEIDLHLHPKQQESFVTALTNTFPNCQFIVTAHTKLPICENEDTLCYLLKDGKVEEVD